MFDKALTNTLLGWGQKVFLMNDVKTSENFILEIQSTENINFLLRSLLTHGIVEILSEILSKLNIYNKLDESILPCAVKFNHCFQVCRS